MKNGERGKERKRREKGIQYQFMDWRKSFDFHSALLISSTRTTSKTTLTSRPLPPRIAIRSFQAMNPLTFPLRRRKSMFSLSFEGELPSSTDRTLLIRFFRSLEVSHDLNHSFDSPFRIGGRRFLILSYSLFLDPRYSSRVSRSLNHGSRSLHAFYSSTRKQEV